MRSADRAVPTINSDRPAVEPFPAQLHIGIERQPLPVYVWDDYSATWDDGLRRYTWDDVDDHPYQRFDLWCSFHGLTITTGNPDAEGAFESGFVEMTLDNRDGALSIYDDHGRLVDWQPGSPLDIWAVYAGEAYWLFSGRITAWRERTDGTIDVEAFDGFSELNQYLAEWTPGVAGQSVGQRMTSICAEVGYRGAKRFASGDVFVLTEATTATALEAMLQTARSDGGVVYCDADGTLVYDDRRWTAGRDDQETVRRLSDNYCSASTTIVWDAEQSTTDEAIVNWLTASNIATPTPVTVSAQNAASIVRYGAQSWPSDRTDDLWTTALEGSTLAAFIVAQRGGHRLMLEQASLYMHDARVDLWPVGLDLRLGDVVEWWHEQATTEGPALFVLILAVNTIIHEITPDTWVTTLATTPAIDHRGITHWDRSPFTWDQADPLNVWF